jgi:hypothetical protein
MLIATTMIAMMRATMAPLMMPMPRRSRRAEDQVHPAHAVMSK